jgi:hypothetical protein
MTATDMNSGTENKAPATVENTDATVKGFPPEYTARLAGSKLNPYNNDSSASTEILRGGVIGQNPPVSDIIREFVGEQVTGDLHSFTGIARTGTPVELSAAAPGDEIKLTTGQEALIQNTISKDNKTLGVTALRVNEETGKISAAYFSADKIQEVIRLDDTTPVISGQTNLRRTPAEEEKLKEYSAAAQAVADKYNMEKESAAFLCLATDTKDPSDLSKVDKMAADFKGGKFVGPMSDAQTLYAIGKMGNFAGAEHLSVQDGKFTTTVTVAAGHEKDAQQLVDTYKNDPAFQILAHARTDSWNVKPIVKQDNTVTVDLDSQQNVQKKPVITAPKV